MEKRQRLITVDESRNDPSRSGQTQPDRQEVMGVAGLRQGQRSQRVTLFTLRHWQHPLNLLAFSRSHTHAVTKRSSSESWWLFIQTDWKSRINKSNQWIDLSVCLLNFCASGCVCVSSGQSVRPLIEWLECEGTLHPCTSLWVYVIGRTIMDLTNKWLIMEGVVIVRWFVYICKANVSSVCAAPDTGPMSGKGRSVAGGTHTHTQRLFPLSSRE